MMRAVAWRRVKSQLCSLSQRSPLSAVSCGPAWLSAAAKCYHRKEMYKQKMALPVVIGRIVAVSSMGLAAAIAILAFVGGLWLAGLIAVAVTALFMGMMFLIERGAEQG